MSQVHLEFPWASSPSALLSPMLHPGLGKNLTSNEGISKQVLWKTWGALVGAAMEVGVADLLETLRLSHFRCWINSEHVLVHYITICGYFGLVFLFNTVIFGVVAWKNCHLWSTGMVQGHCKAWRVALAVVGLFCLLGVTWALTFLSYGSSSVIMLYLSAILNSLQGQRQLEARACWLPGLGWEDMGGKSQLGSG